MLDEKTKKQLRDIEFVEAVSTDAETQNLLLESLSGEKNPDNWIGPFSSVDDMSDYFVKEMEKEGYRYNKEKDEFEKIS